MAARDVTDAVDLRGRQAIAAVDFHETRIYALDAPGHSTPEHVKAEDPQGLFHNVYHRAGNPDGSYEDDSPEYWRTLAHALSPASEVLILGHGKGKANASHHLVAFLEKHFSDVAAKIVADVRVDIDDITDNQLLRLGQLYFNEEPARELRQER